MRIIDRISESNLVMQFIKFCNAYGCAIPILNASNEWCIDFWKSRTNENAINDNAPILYTKKSDEFKQFLINFISSNINKHDRILELGCNACGNLRVLHDNGYTNLSGIEINKNAIVQIPTDLNVNIINGDITKELSKIPDNSYDLLYSVAVLLHIHPEHNDIFMEIARISNKYIMTIEIENKSCYYVFPRNYKKIFNNLGYSEIKYIELKNAVGLENLYDYTARLFKKDEEMK